MMAAALSCRLFIAMLLLLTVASVHGCSEDATKPKPLPPEPDRTTKAGLIEFFAEAHEERDITAFETSLHTDYEFWFSEDDRTSPGWNWANWISKTLDVNLTKKMFEADAVTDVRAEFLNLTLVPGAETSEDNFWEQETTIGGEVAIVYWAEFQVDIHVVEADDDGTIDHWVDGRAKFYLLPDPQCDGLWQIWKIVDLGNVHRKSESATWSRLKVKYK